MKKVLLHLALGGGMLILPVLSSPAEAALAGHSFTRTTFLNTFTFDPPYQSFAAITFNPLTQTYFMTDNKLDKLFELQANGALIRTIDIGGLKHVGVSTTTDAEGIAWMHGQTFALALHDGKEIAVLDISAGATTLTRAQATIYDVSSGPGKPKGLVYAGWEDAFYWVAKDAPKAVIKAHIDKTTGQWLTDWEKNVDSLPVSNLADVALFPRLSHNLFLVSESSQTVMEVDVSGASPVLVSSMSIATDSIPQAGGLTFGANGKMVIVGKHVPGVPQNDFTAYTPSPAVANLPPLARISSLGSIIDHNGDGKETVVVNGSISSDPDGALVSYEWDVNGVKVSTGFGPTVGPLSRDFVVGNSTVTLMVVDDALQSNSTSTLVSVLPSAPNLPPVAEAIVPGTVLANGNGTASVFVDARASSDPEGDRIVRYVWSENFSTLYDGASATPSLALNGLGSHSLTLQVFSVDTSSVTQGGSHAYQITLLAPGVQKLAGYEYDHIVGKDFSLPNGWTTLEDFTGINYSPLTQTFFVTDNDGDAVMEIQADGTVLRVIDVHGLKNPDPGVPNADPEGLVWMNGQTYAIILGKGEELAVVQITPATTSLQRNNATVYRLFGDPHGVAYSAHDNTFFWVSENNPMLVVQSRINPGSGNLDTLRQINMNGLIPADKLGDIAIFPKLSPYVFLMSHSTPTVMEMDFTGSAPVLKSQYSLTDWPIPDAHGLGFGPDGKMYVVGKHVAAVPQDDFSVFNPVPAIGDQAPWVFALVPPQIFGDGHGEALARVDASASFDPENDLITRFRWTLDHALTLYDGPNPVTTLAISSDGVHVLTLSVFSNAGGIIESRSVDFTITVNLNQGPSGTSPLPNNVPFLSVNYVYPGSPSQQVEFVFELSSPGQAQIRVFDPLGREVKKLDSDQVPAGQYRQTWDLTNEDGKPVASGVYFALIKTPSQTNKEKVLVVR